MSIHFLLLGSPASAINVALSALRTWISRYYPGKRMMMLFLATN